MFHRVKYQKYTIYTILESLFALIISFLILLPLFVFIIASVKTQKEIFTNVFAIPKHIHWENYYNAFVLGKIQKYFFNSLFYTASAITSTLIIVSLASYAFTRLKIWGSNFLYLFLLTGNIIPLVAIIIPMYFVFATLGFLDSYLAITLAYTVVNISFGVLILTPAMKTIPKSIAESSEIDGCSHLKIFYLHYLPLSVPTLTTLAVMYFIRMWNDYIFALILSTHNKYHTITIGLKVFLGKHSTQYDQLAAGLIIAIIPTIIIYKWGIHFTQVSTTYSM